MDFASWGATTDTPLLSTVAQFAVRPNDRETFAAAAVFT